MAVTRDKSPEPKSEGKTSKKEHKVIEQPDDMDVDDVPVEQAAEEEEIDDQDMPELEKMGKISHEDLTEKEFKKDCGIALLKGLLKAAIYDKEKAIATEHYEKAKVCDEQIQDIRKHLAEAEIAFERTKAFDSLSRRSGPMGLVDLMNPMRTVRLLQVSGFGGASQILICIFLLVTVVVIEYFALTFFAPGMPTRIAGGLGFGPLAEQYSSETVQKVIKAGHETMAEL